MRRLTTTRTDCIAKLQLGLTTRRANPSLTSHKQRLSAAAELAAGRPYHSARIRPDD